MSASDHRALTTTRSFSIRPVASAGGVLLAASIAFLVLHIARHAPAIFAVVLSGLAGLAVVALALTLEDSGLPKLTLAALAGAGFVALGAVIDSQEARLRLFSLPMAALGVAVAVWVARSGPPRLRLPRWSILLFAPTLTVLSAYAASLPL